MEPLKKVQVEGHLMFAEPHDLFGNLDELCYVSNFGISPATFVTSNVIFSLSTVPSEIGNLSQCL